MQPQIPAQGMYGSQYGVSNPSYQPFNPYVAPNPYGGYGAAYPYGPQQQQQQPFGALAAAQYGAPRPLFRAPLWRPPHASGASSGGGGASSPPQDSSATYLPLPPQQQQHPPAGVQYPPRGSGGAPPQPQQPQQRRFKRHSETSLDQRVRGAMHECLPLATYYPPALRLLARTLAQSSAHPPSLALRVQARRAHPSRSLSSL